MSRPERVGSCSISIAPLTSRSAERTITGMLYAEPDRFWQSWQWQANASNGAALRL